MKLMRCLFRCVFLCSASLLICAQVSAKTPANAPLPKKPNIIFILADDLGFNQLGAFGSTDIKTPTLDKLAAEGIKFTQAYSGGSVCSPSRVSLFTGRDGRTLHDNSNLIKLRKGDVTFAHVLQNAGYETALFGKYSIGNADLKETGPLVMGFDHWYGMNHLLEGHRQYPTFLWRNDEKITIDANLHGAKGAYAQELFTQEAIQFIKQKHEKPFFAYLAYTTPHGEMAAPKEFVDQYSGKYKETPYTGMSTGKPADQYATYYPDPIAEPRATMSAMVTSMDTYIGHIVKALKEQGIADNTLIIFTSDNGPHAESGAQPVAWEAAKPYRGFKRDLYDGGIHVPMIVHWPAAIKKARIDATPWAFADVLPTFADLGGISLNNVRGAQTNGVSVASLFRDRPAKLPERLMYWEFGLQLGDPNSKDIAEAYQAARKNQWKAVRYSQKNPIELYDIIRDPGETKNVAAAHPKLMHEFTDLFEKYKERDR